MWVNWSMTDTMVKSMRRRLFRLSQPPRRRDRRQDRHGSSRQNGQRSVEMLAIGEGGRTLTRAMQSHVVDDAV
jgi:hypothetical protein